MNQMSNANSDTNDLLIATINKLVVLRDGRLETISKGNYYGITWDSEFIYCSKNEPHLPVSRIQIFDKQLKVRGHLPVKYIGGVHQIFSNNRNLYITNTSSDRIDIYDGSETINKISWTNSNKDKFHINSIWINEDRIYVAESGLGGELYPPTIQVLDKQHQPIERIELPGAIHIHNIYIENGALYCCGKFGLVRNELNKSNRYSTIDLRTDQKNGFFRGLARSKDFFYIGESQVLPRAERPYGDARIIVLDNNLEIRDVIDLKDVGQMQDIRIINERDFAHNGIIFRYEN